jgi:hypothetical protein
MVADVLEAVTARGLSSVVKLRMERAWVAGLNVLCERQWRGTSEQCRGDRSHSEIAHRNPQRQNHALATVACAAHATLANRHSLSAIRSAISSFCPRAMPPALLRALTTFVVVTSIAAPRVARTQDNAAAPVANARRYPLNPETAARPSVRAMRTDAHIEIDGRIDEAAWRMAEPLTDFVQQLPNTGALATHPTIVRVLYDGEQLYVSAVCVQKKGDIIVAGLERDVASGSSDIFGLTLDTFLDRRNSFLFLVNPGGAIRDEQTFNDSRNVVDAWEGVLRAKTIVSDTAWTVEIFPGDTIRAGAYSWREGTAGYTSSGAYALSGNVRVTTGDFYDGSRTSLALGSTWRPRYDVLMELVLQRNMVDLPQGSFDADVAGLRLRYSWSTSLFGMAFVQYNAESKQVVTNARINFRYAPMSDEFLVYTDRRNQRTDVTNERSIAIKATKLVAF